MLAETRRRIGTAGWNIPRAHRDRFPADGSQLARYAARLNAVEINSSFYRPHAAGTYERWAAAVPAGFRSAVKVPRLITHERALTASRIRCGGFWTRPRGSARSAVVLVQLPPSLAFDARRVGRFLGLLRASYDGPVVCEPRHATWTSPPAGACWRAFTSHAWPPILRGRLVSMNRRMAGARVITDSTGRRGLLRVLARAS